MKTLTAQFSEAIAWLRDFASTITLRRDTAPIDTVERLDAFVRARAALITQKKLYGYLKERMGMSYPKMFDDDQFARSIDIATMHVYAAALADMTIWAVAHVGGEGRIDRSGKLAWATECYRKGIAENADRLSAVHDPRAWEGEFRARAEETNWDNVAAGASPFTASPRALIRYAPISDEHKRYDREIVENSIRFAWNEVLTELRSRLDVDKVAADWNARGAV